MDRSETALIPVQPKALSASFPGNSILCLPILSGPPFSVASRDLT